MLAKVFAAFMRCKFPLECFRRLAAAIDTGFYAAFTSAIANRKSKMQTVICHL